MTVINWKPHYETGFAVIDDQHKMLVNLINQAAPMLLSDSAQPNDCADLLDALFKYMAAHCAQEEQLMAEYGVGEQHLAEHRLSHQCFQQHIVSLRQQFQENKQFGGAALLRFLSNWLDFHVLGQDLQMARELRAVKAGCRVDAIFREDLQNHPVPMQQSHDLLISALVNLFDQFTDQNSQLIEKTRQLEQARQQLENCQIKLQSEVDERTLALQNAKAEAEEASQSKSRFLGIMSHELLTPLNAILGFAHLLEQADIPSKQRQHAARIVRSSEHLHDLLDQILQFSRLETGEIDSQRCSFAPSSLLKQVAEHINKPALEKHIEVTTYHDPALPRLLGDVRLLRQVLEILAGNALKFTDQGRIHLTAFQLDTPEQRVSVAFEVQDTGIGIPLERQSLLFQPFAQMDSSKTRRHTGIGLGLVICARLVALLGGTLTVKSSPGSGSTFRISLTLDRAVNIRYPSLGKPQQPIGLSLNQLIELLKQGNMDARRLYYCLQPSLFEADAEMTNRLSDQVQNYEFEQALQTLNQLMLQNASQLKL